MILWLATTENLYQRGYCEKRPAWWPLCAGHRRLGMFLLFLGDGFGFGVRHFGAAVVGDSKSCRP